MNARAIYCVADANVFLGAVAMVNSLRLVGHREPVLVLDCGLEDEQRRLLEREATVVPAPEGSTPHLLKHVLPLAEPAEVMLLVDCDIIVTQSVELLFELAARGDIVGFADRLEDRFDRRWSELLGLGAPVVRTYVNSGFLALPGDPGRRLLADLGDKARLVDPARSMIGAGSALDPFYFLDQDVLNALLATRPDGLVALESRLAPHPPFQGVRLRDPSSLDCAYDDGERPFALHHIQAKPWLEPLRPTGVLAAAHAAAARRRPPAPCRARARPLAAPRGPARLGRAPPGIGRRDLAARPRAGRGAPPAT